MPITLSKVVLACCLLPLLFLLSPVSLAFPSAKEQLPAAGSQSADVDNAHASLCRDNAGRGLFEPQCFVSTGSGDSLISEWDAAYNAAAGFLTNRNLNRLGTGATVRWDGQYRICNAQQGIVLPQNGSEQGGPGINLVGGGPGAQLSLSCRINRKTLPPGAAAGSPISNAAIWMPVQASPRYTMYNWHDFTLYANGQSAGCMDMAGLIHVSQFTNIVLGGAGGDGTPMSNCMRWGNSKYEQATANQVELHNISITPGGNGGGSDFVASTMVSGGIPIVHVINGGHDYSRNVYLYLVGPPSVIDPQTGVTAPCTTMGSIKETVTSGSISAPVLHGFSGCSTGTMVRAFDPVFPVNYGVWFDSFTDSQYIQLNPQTGRLAAVYAGSRTGNNHYQAVHTCCFMPTGFVELGQGDSFVAFYADGVGQRAMSFGRGASASLQQSKLYWNATAKMTFAQAGGYSFGEGVGPVTISGGTCNVTGLQNNGGYAHIVSQLGANIFPSNLVLVADADCSTNQQVTNLHVSPWKAITHSHRR